jgi:hypothetical protein
MLKYAIGGSIAIILLLSAALLISLGQHCSLEKPVPQTGAESKGDGSENRTKNTESNQQGSAPHSTQTKGPTATFELGVAERNKIEGRYYTEGGEGEKENWWHKFWREAKLGEFLLAVFTLFLVLFTGRFVVVHSSPLAGWRTSAYHDAKRRRCAGEKHKAAVNRSPDEP